MGIPLITKAISNVLCINVLKRFMLIASLSTCFDPFATRFD
jgi:hypothetical protein